MKMFTNRRAEIEDLDLLLPVVEEFYQHFGFSWDMAAKRRLLEEFLQKPEAGGLWVVQEDGKVVGYALVAFYFALEFGGQAALLDEFFVLPRLRGQGVGAGLLKEVTETLIKGGITRLRLEVDERHPEAADLYRRAGFKPDGRQMWSRAD